MIKDVKCEHIYHITTDEGEYNQYVRRGANSWFVYMGESLEPLYDCESIECDFQDLLKRLRKEVGIFVDK